MELREAAETRAECLIIQSAGIIKSCFNEESNIVSIAAGSLT